MEDPIRLNERVLGPQPLGPQTAGRNRAAKPTQGPSFAETMQQVQKAQAAGLRFSGHAQTRIASREIALNAGHMERIQGAVQRAEAKGSRDSLILLEHAALVVNIPNRTVITVVDQQAMKENVFTNIDSAVIA